MIRLGRYYKNDDRAKMQFSTLFPYPIYPFLRLQEVETCLWGWGEAMLRDKTGGRRLCRWRAEGSRKEQAHETGGC